MSEQAFVISGDAFGAQMPRRYTHDGENVSPPVWWKGTPDAARSLALILEDVTSEPGGRTRWLMYDLPPELHGLPVGPCGLGKRGRTDQGTLDYRGPEPAPGRGSRYRICLLALDVDSLGLAEGASAGEVRRAAENHVLGEARAECRYGTT